VVPLHRLPVTLQLAAAGDAAGRRGRTGAVEGENVCPSQRDGPDPPHPRVLCQNADLTS